MATINSFFLCSQDVINAFPECERSKPFKSGFENDEGLYYVALLDFDVIDRFYREVVEPKDDVFNDFWCRECVPGQMDVSKITLSGMRRNGVFYEISVKIGLTTEKNQAMTIYNLSQKYNCTPIELINKVVCKQK
jgi:hypothetical protein